MESKPDQFNLSRKNLTPNTKPSSFRLRTTSLNKVRLRRIFDMFDRNSDSIITIDELTLALEKLGLQADPSEIEEMVVTYSKPDINGGLTYDDFENLHRSLNDAFFCGSEEGEVEEDDQKESDLNEAFKVFDENGDGFISAKELQIVLVKLGLQEEGKEIARVEKMIECVDRNHDGRVDFFEFKDMMRSVMVPN